MTLVMIPLCRPVFAQELGSTLTWSGDLRVRGQSESTEAADSRRSLRLRGRFGVKAKVDDSLQAEFRLASSNNYRSTNQSLGDSGDPGFARRFMGLDLAYAEWKPSSALRLHAGRIPQWHQRPGGSQIILDEDIALEGLALRGEYGFADSWSVQAGVGTAFIRENYDDASFSADETDNVLHSMDLALNKTFADSSLKFGLSFFNFVGIQNRLFSELAAGGAALGNSEFPAGRVKNNFRPLRAYLEGKTKWGSLEYSSFVERVVNEDTRDPNRAWWVGVGLKDKAWSSQLAYAELETDAVPAVFTFSDFAAGQTDARGFIFSFQYDLAKNVALKLTQFANRQKFSVLNTQYLRTHLDLSVAF